MKEFYKNHKYNILNGASDLFFLVLLAIVSHGNIIVTSIGVIYSIISYNLGLNQGYAVLDEQYDEVHELVEQAREHLDRARKNV